MDPTRTARVIFRAGIKVEVSFEEERFRDVWFPATVVEDLGNDLFLVEYNCLEGNDESRLCRVTVDRLHIRPSFPQIRVTNFDLLEKVDAFIDFGWWSGVVTKKLADSRYIVYFKRTNKVKELGHLELRLHVDPNNEKWFTPDQVLFSSDVEHEELRENVSNQLGLSCQNTKSESEACVSSLNFTMTVEDTNTSIDKQTSIVTTSMKRANLTDLGSNLTPSKKSKDGVVRDDTSLSNGGQSEEVSNPTVGQTFHDAENLSSKKKKHGKREKNVELKRDMITSARKKGKLSADSGGLKTLPQAAGDSTIETAANIVEKKHVANSPIPVVVGLQCYAVTVSQSKKSKQMTSESPQNVVEPKAPQSGVLLLPNATGNEEGEETFGDTIIKRKRGRPFKTKSKKGKTSLAGNHKNGDRSGMELTLQPEKYDKPVKGKRAKRLMISLNITSSPQVSVDLQDSSIQKENGNSEINVEKSLDTESDDQPLSRWFLGNPSLAALESTGMKQPENSESLLALTNGDGQTLTFEKRSSLWETIESMEVFRLIPQNPHFRPLDNIKESARERHAINKMVDFCGVFEETRRLRIDHPRTEIEDQLETLSELETHGFDIDFIRNRLMELISLKDKREGIENQSKEVKDKLGNLKVNVQKLEYEIESIDKQVSDLLEKRGQILKEKEKEDSEIVRLESEIHEIEEGLREYGHKFDEFVTASFV